MLVDSDEDFKKKMLLWDEDDVREINQIILGAKSFCQLAILSTHKNLFNGSKRANFSAIMGDKEAHGVHYAEPLKGKKQFDTFLMLKSAKFVFYQGSVYVSI